MILWKIVQLSLFLTCFVYVTRVFCDESKKIGALPFCDPSKYQDNKRLVFVSTLDGKLSALNIEDGGSEKWSLWTQPGAMLSSSIHRLELTNNGQWVRMIPSLSGGLYKFNGEDIEPIPITVENLLKSSFRYSDDLVISGGKESRTYGVDMGTGRVLYECSMNRCDNLTGAQDSVGDVVLVQRLTQTVRAIEPRSGTERWNFSVGQHDIKMAPNPEADCHTTSDPSTDVILKVIVPDGLLCAVSKSKPGTVVWKHKFEFPIVSAWEVENRQLKWVDLFGGNKDSTNSPREIPESPILYIGMHNKQLYIQESVRLQKKIVEGLHRRPYDMITDETSVFPRIPWKPVPASEKGGQILGISGPTEPVLQITDENSQASTTALSVLYGSEYVNGNGFFLYSAESVRRKETALCSPNDQFNFTVLEKDSDSNSPEDSEETPVKIIIVSMWYWWKEIAILSICTAVIINQLFFIAGKRINSKMGEVVPAIVKSGEPESGSAWRWREADASSKYVSRYLTDFEPVHCLGKGGFGIVFEAKNKIDDCHYAIKRIPLPNKEVARRRVMREVKALAKLDHHNIVRYFNAWVEWPPAQWQAQQDAVWAQLCSNELRSDDAITLDLSGHITPTSERNRTLEINQMKNRKKTNPLKSFWDKASSFYTERRAPTQVLSPSAYKIDSSDSFIVFENSANDDSDGENSESIVFENLDSWEGAEEEESEGGDAAPRRPKTLEIGTSDESGGRGADPRGRVYLYIQMQLCQRDSLREWLAYNTHERDSKQALGVFSQIVHAVEYVHLQGLIHRDLKPSNIFFSPDGQIKVGDFGLVTGMVDSGEGFMSPLIGGTTSTHPHDRHTARVGTQLYMSPEQLGGLQYNYKVDIYSLGLILFELLVPFNTQMERLRTLTNVRNNKFPPQFKDKFPNEYELLRLMLCEEPEKRLTTIGIRHREPLCRSGSRDTNGGDHPEEEDGQHMWHFALPQRRRNSSTSKSFSSHDS